MLYEQTEIRKLLQELGINLENSWQFCNPKDYVDVDDWHKVRKEKSFS